MTEVNLPDSITLIKKNAFRNCSGLTSIQLPANLETIEDDAFRGCSGITALSLPDGIRYIGNTAFIGMNEVTELVIPNSVEYIGTSLFGNDFKLESITLPFAGETPATTAEDDFMLITMVGFSSYNGEIPLHSVTLTGGHSIPKRYFNCLDNVDALTLPDTLIDIGDAAFYTKYDRFQTGHNPKFCVNVKQCILKTKIDMMRPAKSNVGLICIVT